MSQFEIQLPSELGKDPAYTPEDEHEDLSNLQDSVWSIGQWYLPIESRWQIILSGGDVYPLSMNEISWLWDFIPYHLQEVVAATDPTEIGIIELGIDLGIEVEPADEGNILVSIVLGEEDCRRNEWFKPNPKPAQSPKVMVKREDYIQEWWKFVRWVVDIMIANQLIEPDDPSIQAYLDEMPPASETKSS